MNFQLESLQSLNQFKSNTVVVFLPGAAVETAGVTVVPAEEVVAAVVVVAGAAVVGAVVVVVSACLF